MSLDFGDEKAEEAIRRQVAALEIARDEIDAIRQARQNGALEAADHVELDKRYELAAQVHDKAQDERDRLLGISPDTIAARRKREQARDLEREHTGASFKSEEGDDSATASGSPPTASTCSPPTGRGQPRTSTENARSHRCGS